MEIDVVDLSSFFTCLLRHASNSSFANFDDYNCILKNLSCFFLKDFSRSRAVMDLVMLKQNRFGVDLVLFFAGPHQFWIPLDVDPAIGLFTLIGPQLNDEYTQP